MTIDEVRRLDEGPLPGETLGVGVVTLQATCRGEAASIEAKVREVIRPILTAQKTDWPDTDTWRSLLPQWFVAACAPEMTREQAERWLVDWRAMTTAQQAAATQNLAWGLADWLHWMRPDQKTWRLWEIRTIDPDTLRFSVAIESWPFAHGALDWLLRAAGAIAVAEE